MSSPAHRYPDWKAPANDGEVLIWPDPATIRSETIENHQALQRAEVTLQNVPLHELRRSARHWIGHVDDDQPLIASGHQTELYHPGVWAKDVLANHLAEKLNGQAFHFAVDTDSPKHLHLRWPGGREPLSDDPNLGRAEWTGLLDAPSPAHLRHLESVVPGSPLLREFLASLRRQALETPQLSTAMTNAMHALDWELGLRHHAMLVSPIWIGESYLVYVHHLIANASRFAAVYNDALREYRAEHKVRAITRPMPNLAITDETIELPLWLDNLQTGHRTRAHATRRGETFELRANGDTFNFPSQAAGLQAAVLFADWLRSHHLRLSPRALTLTTFLRLIVVDQFIHGIGGGRYDQISDTLIQNFFKIAAPKFSVTTATLYLPDALGQVRTCLPCVRQDGHRLKHSLLGEQKRELVAAIAAAPRGSIDRQQTFYELHRRLSEAAQNHPALREWEENLEQTRQREAEESALFDRELFYAMQPRERLVELIERYRQRFE